MDESAKINNEQEQERAYSDILDQKLENLMEKVSFTTIKTDDLSDLMNYKQLAESLQKQLQEKENKIADIIAKGREIQAKYKESVNENKKLKEKISIQPDIIEEFRSRLTLTAWRFFTDPSYLQKHGAIDPTVFKQCMKKVAIPQQNTVTRTTNAFNNATESTNGYKEVVTNSQTAQKINSTI